MTGVAGFVKPGDFVDVIVTFDANTAGADVSHVVLQNMQVLSIYHGQVEEQMKRDLVIGLILEEVVF